MDDSSNEQKSNYTSQEATLNALRKPVFDPSNIISDTDFIITPPDFDIQKFLESKRTFLATYKINGRLVSDIIKEASQYVSAKVIIVQLEKEQSIISTPGFPTQHQMDWAMGFGKEGGGVTKSQYQGMENQILHAAKRMRDMYENGAQQYIGDISKTLPADAGYTDGPLTVVNKATVALYRYTPHITTPDGGGNKLFWEIWNKYFA